MRSIFKNARGIRAGWRLLIYAALVFAFGYAATRLSDALSHGRQWDYASPVVQIVAMAVILAVLLSAAATMAKIEGRSIAEYGLPWWRAFCVKFWQASAIGFISLAVLLAVLRAANAYSVGSLQIHGIEILKNAILWAVAVILAAMVEEFFYRGYIQFTLSDGIGFWPAAVVASAIMGGMHALNPGWTALGLALACADLVGVMEGAVQLATAYATERHQYGAAIGSFQAVQHLLADAHVLTEGSRSVTLHASWAVDELPTAEALDAAAVAKAYCTRAARQVCETVIQVHGGTGNTWECLAHVYLRRSLLSGDLLGDAEASVTRVLRHRGIGGDHGLP